MAISKVEMLKDGAIGDLKTLNSICSSVFGDLPIELKLKRLEYVKTKCVELSGTLSKIGIKQADIRKSVKNILKGLEAVHNHTQSIIDMLESNDLTKEERARFIEKQTFRLNKLRTLILGLFQNDAVMAKLNAEVSDDFNNEALTDSDTETVTSDEGESMKEIAGSQFPEIENALKNIGPYLKGNERFRSQIPKESNQLIVLRKMPIIPLFTGSAPSAEDLSMAGFDVDKFGNRYVVLNNQIVVGVNLSKTDQVKSAKRGRASDESNNDFLNSVHDQLESQLGSLERIGTSKGTEGFQWFWFVKTSMINRLNSTGKRLGVSQWDFALQRLNT